MRAAPAHSARVVLGLGSNKGDRIAHLSRALALLEAELGTLERSPVYESAAMLPEGAPPEWDMPYYNMAASAETPLSPRALLALAGRVEQACGRTREGRWGPREMDVDILAYGAHIVREEGLVIPHEGLALRDFALLPLADLWPDWACPVPGPLQGRSARELASRMALRRVEATL